MARKLEIRIPAVPVLWIVLLGFVPIEGFLLYLYHNHREWRETIIFGATIVGGAFALYAHMKQIEDNRAKYAEKLMERWNSPNPEFELWKDTLRSAFAGTLDPRTLIRTKNLAGAIILPRDLIMRNRVVGLLSYCEEVALAIRMNLADEEIIQRVLQNVLVLSWHTFKPWIDGERDTLGKPGDDLYIELQRIVEKWER